MSGEARSTSDPADCAVRAPPARRIPARSAGARWAAPRLLPPGTSSASEEKAIHQAMGRPSTSNTADTVIASCSVSQNACQSIAIVVRCTSPEKSPCLLQREAVLPKQLGRLFCLDVFQKLRCFLSMLGVREQHHTLRQRRVGVRRNLPILSFAAHCWRDRMGQRHEPCLRIA